MDHEPQSPWWPLEADDLPGTDATLKDMVNFERTINPVAVLRERWGDSYEVKSEAVHRGIVKAFKEASDPGMPPDALLLCFAMEVNLGPYLGIGGERKMRFLHWLLALVRQGLRDHPVQFRFWFSERHGFIRRRSNMCLLRHPEVWRAGRWHVGAGDVADEIAGMGTGPGHADALDEQQARDYAAEEAIDLFADNPDDPHPPVTSLRPAHWRIIASREDSGEIWGFYLRNEGVRPVDLMALNEVGTEWGGRRVSTPVDVRFTDLAPGALVRFWETTVDDAEMRMTLSLRFRRADRDANMRFTFPRMDRQSGTIIGRAE